MTCTVALARRPRWTAALIAHASVSRHQLLLLVPGAPCREAPARSSRSGTSAVPWTMRWTSRRGAARRPPARVERWRRELAACFEGGTPETPQGRALVPLIAQFNLPRAAFEALIEGVEMDLGDRRYETFADLYRVLHSRGLGRRPDLPEDLRLPRPASRAVRDRSRGGAAADQHPARRPGGSRRGRVYIPQEDLRAHGCSEADLRAEMAGAGGGVRSPAVKALLRHQAIRARDYYAPGGEGAAAT